VWSVYFLSPLASARTVRPRVRFEPHAPDYRFVANLEPEDSITVETSRLHSLSRFLANRRRKLVLTPDYINWTTKSGADNQLKSRSDPKIEELAEGIITRNVRGVG
jgi:hypothetical protein